MGYPMEEARQFFRISFGPSTTFEEIDQLTAVLSEMTCCVL